MPSVADALRAFAPEYRQRFGPDVPLGHLKVLNAITKCRTGELGGVVFECEQCGRDHWTGRSCGNRHCPTCQHDRTLEWTKKQLDRLIPVPYFCVTFTVPQEIRLALRAHQSEGYRLLFEAAHEAMAETAAGTRGLSGSELGYFGVLHTWGRDPMVYHPHVHFVVPGVGVVVDRKRQPTACRPTSADFLMHHGTLIRKYRRKLKGKLSAAGITASVPRPVRAAAWKKNSVVDIKPVGDGSAVLKYLAPYVYRVAISDRRIQAIDATHVTYSVKPTGSTASVSKRVVGWKFVAGFLQHVLPRGFHKIRYYGWLNPRRRIDVDEIRLLVCVALGLFFLLRFTRGDDRPEPESAPCRHCGGPLRLARMVFFNCRFRVDFCQDYLDSS